MEVKKSGGTKESGGRGRGLYLPSVRSVCIGGKRRLAYRMKG